MKDKIIISADSICDLPKKLIEEYSIQMVPFYINMEDVRFLDYEETDFNSMYEYLVKNDRRVSSAPASVMDYKNFFQNLATDEERTVIHICISGRLSEAYRNAWEAAKEMKNVYVINSGQISHGMGLLVLAVAELAKSGAKAQEILREIDKIKARISCSFVFKSTQYIANNHRLNPMIANLLDIFLIKPIVRMKHDKLKLTGICLGGRNFYVRRYIRWSLRKAKRISDDVLFITVLSDSQELRELVYYEATRKIKWKQVYVQDVTVATLCNMGPGSVGLTYYYKM